ncbi:hypothetical protein [uncultured Draconibacterium sp.]|uniref:hypothetical protein n=1 Tax=uncultured Draconibacterium sp. TaxID=1573823 RepID=UPI003217BF23
MKQNRIHINYELVIMDFTQIKDEFTQVKYAYTLDEDVLVQGKMVFAQHKTDSASGEIYSARSKTDSASHKELFLQHEEGSAPLLTGFQPMKMVSACSKESGALRYLPKNKLVACN